MMRVCQRQRRLLWESLRESLSVLPFTRAFLKSPSSRGLSAIAELLVWIIWRAFIEFANWLQLAPVKSTSIVKLVGQHKGWLVGYNCRKSTSNTDCLPLIDAFQSSCLRTRPMQLVARIKTDRSTDPSPAARSILIRQLLCWNVDANVLLASIASDPISDMHRRRPTSDRRPNYTRKIVPQSVCRVMRNINLLNVYADITQRVTLNTTDGCKAYRLLESIIVIFEPSVGAPGDRLKIRNSNYYYYCYIL